MGTMQQDRKVTTDNIDELKVAIADGMEQSAAEMHGDCKQICLGTQVHTSIGPAASVAPPAPTLVELQCKDKEIAERAAGLRLAAKKTNREIAAELGVSPEALVRIERRESERARLLETGDQFADLTTRTRRALNEENIHHIVELLSFSPRSLFRSVPNLGKKGVAEIAELLRKQGLSLQPDT